MPSKGTVGLYEKRLELRSVRLFSLQSLGLKEIYERDNDLDGVEDWRWGGVGGGESVIRVYVRTRIMTGCQQN